MMTGLVTCSRLPEGHPDDLLLRPELQKLGVETCHLQWEEALPDGLDALLLRTPWNYHRCLDAFLSWLDGAAALPLWNPPEVVRWNCHKGYLAELYQAGLPVVPTRVWQPENKTHGSSYFHALALDAAEVAAWVGDGPVVCKPAVSAGAFKTSRYDRWGPEALGHIQDLLLTEPAMLQPYFARIEQEGEKALIFIDGQFSHAVRRHLPLIEGPEVDYTMQPVTPSPAELEVARRILDWLPWQDLLYARVDLIPDDQGSPTLLELELIEPQLFMREHPASAAALARAWRRRFP